MMKKLILSVVVMCVLTAMSNAKNGMKCDVDGTTGATTMVVDVSVPYTVANNYFVNNNIGDTVPPVKITSREELEKYFGMAAGMGKDGQPTPIDFSKQYVIAVVKPVTDTLTVLKPKSLKRNKKGNVVFTYKVKTKGTQSYSIRPLLMIVVDKTYDADVVLKEVK